MKADILNYLDSIVRTLTTEAERELNPTKLIQTRAKIEIVGAIATEIKRALPEDETPAPAPVAQPVEAELVD